MAEQREAKSNKIEEADFLSSPSKFASIKPKLIQFFIALKEFIKTSATTPNNIPMSGMQGLNENDETTEFRVYKKRGGCVDLGREYESLMCTYYTLKLCYDKNVIDFKITSNNKIYGDFDDVALTVTFLDGSSHTFLIQLKHTEQEKGITDHMLSNKKGNFCLLKYFEFFQKLQNRDNTSCILFTNRKSQLKDQSEFELENQNIIVSKGQSDNNKHLLMLIDTVSDDEATHIFSFKQKRQNSQDLEDFFKSFYFFTNQKNCLNIRAHIDQLLNEKFGCHVDFINFMRQWWTGSFVFNKHDVIAKLAELVLSPFVQEIPRKLNETLSKKTKLLKSAIMKFELTLVAECDANTIAKIWIKELDDVVLEKISKVALKYGLTSKGLQNKNDLALEQLTKVLWHLDKVPLIVKYVTGKEERIRAAVELLASETTRKRLILIGPKSDETFPKWKFFNSLYDLRNETLYKDIIATFKVSLHKRPSITLETFIGSDTEIAKSIDIKELFLMLEDDLCLGKPLASLPLEYIPRTLKYDNSTVNEDKAFSVFNNSINVITGRPGTGKSTLMTYLSHQCPPDYWCIRVNLIDYMTFLSKKHSTEEIMSEFVKDEDSFFDKVKATFLKNKRIYLLLDGLDEIEIVRNCVGNVLNIVKDISSMGIRVWISSRDHLQDQLTNSFKVSPIFINELSGQNQEKYIKRRLSSENINATYSEEEIETIINGLCTSVIPRHNEKNIFGVPLLLFIFTEIFRNDETILDKLKSEDDLGFNKLYNKLIQVIERCQPTFPTKTILLWNVLQFSRSNEELGIGQTISLW